MHYKCAYRCINPNSHVSDIFLVLITRWFRLPGEIHVPSTSDQLGCTAYTSWNCEGDGLQWLNVLYSGKWIGSVGPIVLSDLTRMDFFFLWGQLKEHVNAVPPKTIEDVKARLQVVVTMVDASVLCSRECRAVHCLLSRNGRRPLRTPILTRRRRWFHHLIACFIWHWRVSWKLTVTGHMLYFRRAFFFLTRDLGRACGRISFRSVYVHPWDHPREEGVGQIRILWHICSKQELRSQRNSNC
jgi:hypothetical protein